MKNLILIPLLLSLTLSAQVGQESEIRVSIDPTVLANESNYNIKIEAETGTYGDNRHRITIGAEILTGHDFYALSIGYGYHIPYRIANVHLSVQPSFNVGVIFREINGEKLKGQHHFLSLRHHIAIGEYWGVYVKNRLIRRPDIQAQVNYEIPFYQVDNAIGLYFKL
jgi:hypothetical protein